MVLKLEVMTKEQKEFYKKYHPEMGNILLHTYLGQGGHIMISQLDTKFVLFGCEMSELNKLKESDNIVDIFDYINEVGWEN